jgi:hypothetical protein
VTFFVLAWVWIAKATIFDKMDAAVYDQCIGTKFGEIGMWISISWILLAFVTILVDERMADNATEGESTSLVV